MGWLYNAFKKGWNHGKEQAKEEAVERRNGENVPVRLVEPSFGKVVELQVTEANESYVNMYLGLITEFAKGLEQFGVKWFVSEKIVHMDFPDNELAQNVRESWKE